MHLAMKASEMDMDDSARNKMQNMQPKELMMAGNVYATIITYVTPPYTSLYYGVTHVMIACPSPAFAFMLLLFSHAIINLVWLHAYAASTSFLALSSLHFNSKQTRPPKCTLHSTPTNTHWESISDGYLYVEDDNSCLN